MDYRGRLHSQLLVLLPVSCPASGPSDARLHIMNRDLRSRRFAEHQGGSIDVPRSRHGQGLDICGIIRFQFLTY